MSLSSAGRTFQLVSRLMDPDRSNESFYHTEPQKPAISMGQGKLTMPCCPPKKQGISSRQIAGFLEALQNDPTLRMHSVLVIRNGNILCRAAFGARDTVMPRMTFSACKSITALAIGILMDDGLLHPDDKLTDFFPDDCGPVSRRLMKDLTIHHVLSMQTGNLFNEAGSLTEDDWIRKYFSSPALETTRKFQYNSLNTYILAALVTRLSGMSLSEFLTRRLFQPMGIADFYWETSPEGIEKGGWGLYMTPEDLGKLGQLVMDGGVWHGKRLVSAEFLAKATTAQVQTPLSCGDFNYGWQIWVGRTENTFLFNGMLGQNVLGFRDSGIILVSHAGNDEAFQTSAYYDLAQQYFGGNFSNRLPADPLGRLKLHFTCRALRFRTEHIPTKREFSVFTGKRYVTDDAHAASAGLLPLILQTVENSFSSGFRAVSVDGKRKAPILHYEELEQQFSLICGIKKPRRQQIIYHGNVFEVAVQARFTKNEDLVPIVRIQIDFLETPCTRILKLISTGQGMVLQQEETPGAAFLLNTMASAISSPTAKTLLSSIFGSSESGMIEEKIRKIFTHTFTLMDESQKEAF